MPQGIYIRTKPVWNKGKSQPEVKKWLNPFKKGHKPWNKGLKIDKNKYPNIGHLKPHTIETKEKLRAIHKPNSGYFKKGHPDYSTEESRKKISLKNRGEKNYFWKGGKMKDYPLIEQIRKSSEYANWRKAIFERDDYRCIDCGQRGGKLNADHIYQFADYPRLRFEFFNGQTLCDSCHVKKTIFERTGKIKMFL